MTASQKSLWNSTDNYFITATEQCRGCGSLLASKLALRAIYESTPDAMVFGRSCGGGRSELQTGGRIGADGSGMMGIEAGFEARGALKDRTLVVMTGDGRALEMGAGDFLGTFDREQALTWIILDNQAYANSGSTATALTPLKTATRVLSRASGGKATSERDMPMMMVFGKARYVATASPAYVRDLVTKIQESLQSQPSYVHIYVPCQVSWRYQPNQVVEIARRMVQTGMTPLWSFKNGVFKRTVKIPEQKKRPIQDFMDLQLRFAGVTEEDIKEIEAHVHRKNKLVDALETALTGPDTVSW
jgi:pyruvate/2-oxoacid:ferredoxin oxidoreductase beta subunit